MNNNIGTLYVVATPIGNLQDITLRAIDVLKRVDRIAAEDTRHAAPLLNHFSIHKPTISLHEFNERERVAVLIDYLHAGENIALISDAGTPLISDPGFRLVREAITQAVPVVPIPGPCAAITALSASGLPTDRFVFEGFLPAKQEAQRQRLLELALETRTIIFYVAPQRVLTVLNSFIEHFGSQRKAVVARELTKRYESVKAGSLTELSDYYTSVPEEQRGEFVILVAGIDRKSVQAKQVIPEAVLDVLLTELPIKQAAQLASKITGERKNVLYEMALSKKPNQTQK